MPVADPSLALQKALVARLKADAAVNAIVAGRIYDGVPLNAPKPYISFGPFDVLPDLGDCLDGAQAVIQLDAWSLQNGSTVQVKQLGAAIAAALDEATFALDAPHVLVDMTVEPIRYLKEPDGLTAHGVLTVNAWCEPRT
jgi:hypothetical protein